MEKMKKKKQFVLSFGQSTLSVVDFERFFLKFWFRKLAVEKQAKVQIEGWSIFFKFSNK